MTTSRIRSRDPQIAGFIGALFIVLLAAVNAQPLRPATLVLFDEAHDNLFTARGEFRGFAQLLTRAGYELRPNDQQFTSEQVLDGASLLIIAGALGADSKYARAANDAFTARENEVLHSWVSSGGALLLVVDHWTRSR